MMINKTFIIGITALFTVFMVNCSSGDATAKDRPASSLKNRAPLVEIKMEGNKMRFFRNGEPYWVKGAAGIQNLEMLKAAGANSFRTYTTDGLDTLLDKAQVLGLTVMVGIWLEKEEEGFDYLDSEQLQRQRTQVDSIVRKHRNHPAVFCWAVGNEVIVFSENAVPIARTINRLAGMIHELDPYHPVTSICIQKNVDLLLNEARQLDFISINTFGGLEESIEIMSSHSKVPFLITEWGIDGFWESEKTRWGSPIEKTPHEKIKFLNWAYWWINHAGKVNCMGSYVFYWGQRQEMTHSWFSLFLENGAKSPEVDALSQLWEGELLGNQAPVIYSIAFTPIPQIISVNDPLSIFTEAADPENDRLTYQWEVTRDQRDFVYLPHQLELRPEAIPGLFISSEGNKLTFKAPPKGGAYRIYVSVYDSFGNGSTTNLPFLVEDNRLTGQ